MHRLKRFCKLFCFREDTVFVSNIWNSCSQRLNTFFANIRCFLHTFTHSFLFLLALVLFLLLLDTIDFLCMPNHFFGLSAMANSVQMVIIKTIPWFVWSRYCGGGSSKDAKLETQHQSDLSPPQKENFCLTVVKDCSLPHFPGLKSNYIVQFSPLPVFIFCVLFIKYFVYVSYAF